MNLVDLIVLVCLLASPGACREQHILLESHGSLRACAMEAQPYLAQWIGQHPGFRIARYHCDWPDREGEHT